MIMLLLILFVALQAADGYLTIVGLRRIGVRELNPLARIFMARTSTVIGTIVFKVAVTAFVALLMLHPRLQFDWATMPGMQLATMILLNLWAGWVVIHNIRVLNRR